MRRRGQVKLRVGLSPREKQVIRLVALGRQNKQIASSLGLTVHTINQYLWEIEANLGMRGRRSLLVGYALREGLVVLAELYAEVRACHVANVMRLATR